MNKKKNGQLAEQRACDFLLAQGLKLITKNFRCAYGEIDLIIRDGDDIVFVEVRSRTHTDYGDAVESVNLQKQKKIVRTATYFLQEQNKLNTENCRFDIVAICDQKLEWIKNAFYE